MRSIKFRAWDKIEKVMINSSEIHWIEFNDNIWLYDYKDKTFGDSSVLILMQFTGLHDKNGKEIYHFDILKTVDKLYLVDWHFNRWVLKDINRNMKIFEFNKIDFEAGFFEKIGDKFSTPELLENPKSDS